MSPDLQSPHRRFLLGGGGTSGRLADLRWKMKRMKKPRFANVHPTLSISDRDRNAPIAISPNWRSMRTGNWNAPSAVMGLTGRTPDSFFEVRSDLACPPRFDRREIGRRRGYALI